MPIVFTPADLMHVLPWIVVVAFAIAVPVLDVFAHAETNRAYAGYLALVGIGAAFALTLWQWGAPPTSAFGGMLRVDAFGLFFNALLLAAAGVTVLLGIGFFHEHGLHRGEFYGLLLMALSGMMLMGMASDLLAFFVALELMSIPIYVLAAFQRHLNQSVEAALKYFLMGAFSTAFLLFGIAFVYGAVGATGYDAVMQFIAAKGVTGSAFLPLGMIFILIGFAFKVAAVPFHMWTPDVYEGAPTVVTGFMATAVKAAAFAAFLRLFITVFYDMKLVGFGWFHILWVLAVATMTLGNLTALMQDNIKRMLAYSSIAHAGYLLVGFLSITRSPDNNGAASLLFYLVAYAAMNLGAFGVVILAGRRDKENLLVSKGWAGFGFRAPALGVAMTIFMLSLAGVPPTAGFMGKFYVFKSAIDQGLVLIAVIGVINSLLSVYYYLRILVFMYMKPAEEGAELAPLRSMPVQVAVVIAVVATLQLGLLPSSFLVAAQTAVRSLF